jgi:hypothetical protein
MSLIDSRHWTISTGRHFQNCHHNIAKIQHGIVVAILKMANSRNCSMSRINSGHHYLPTYQIVMISENVEFLRCLELIPDIEKFLLVPIFKMAATISHKFNIVGQCWIFAVLWWPFWKWGLVEIFKCRESIRDIIIYPHIKCCWNRTMLEKFLPVTIFKMAATISHKFNIVRFQRPELIPDIEKFLPYKMLLKSDNVEFLRYCDSHFENGDR